MRWYDQKRFYDRDTIAALNYEKSFPYYATQIINPFLIQ